MFSIYVVRVDLEEGQRADYQMLHTHMEQVGFDREITNELGEKFRLPKGEYATTAINKSLDEVRDLAMNAADQTEKKYKVLAMQVVSFASAGMRKTVDFIPGLGPARRITELGY